MLSRVSRMVLFRVRTSSRISRRRVQRFSYCSLVMKVCRVMAASWASRSRRRVRTLFLKSVMSMAVTSMMRGRGPLMARVRRYWDRGRVSAFRRIWDSSASLTHMWMERVRGAQGVGTWGKVICGLGHFVKRVRM